MVPKRNQEGPRKEIEVGIEWMRGEKKKCRAKGGERLQGLFARNEKKDILM